jgi:hypothetical protein
MHLMLIVCGATTHAAVLMRGRSLCWVVLAAVMQYGPRHQKYLLQRMMHKVSRATPHALLLSFAVPARRQRAASLALALRQYCVVQLSGNQCVLVPWRFRSCRHGIIGQSDDPRAVPAWMVYAVQQALLAASDWVCVAVRI